MQFSTYVAAQQGDLFLISRDEMLKITSDGAQESLEPMPCAIRAAGGTKVKYTVIEGGTHNIWPTAAATDGLVDWIFAQKNDNYFNTLMGAVAPEYDPLDVNKDGKVDIIDVLFMLEKMMAGSGDYTLATVVKTLGQIVGA